MQKAAGAIDELMALEELCFLNTVVHRIHPLSKLAVTILFVAAVVSVGRLDFAALGIYFFYPAVLMAIAEIPFRSIAKKVLVALPFIVFMGLSNMIFEQAPYDVLWGITLSRGFVSFAVLFQKTVLTVSAVLLLIATTKSARLFSSLSKLGMPKILTILLMLCLRYMSVLLDETDRMIRAYHLRANKVKGIHIKHMGSFVGQLLLRSIDRAERIYQAMKLRGFQGSFPAGYAERMNAASILYMLALCASILFFRFVTVSSILTLLN
jgi:cobalt/nickel transport system permease protein